MSAEPLIECPECHQQSLIKLIGPGVAVIVKGSENPCRGTIRSKTKKEQPKRKDRLGEGKFEGKKPFWRDGPVNKKVLKNPKQYIQKGKVD